MRLIDQKPSHRLRPSQRECVQSYRLMPPQPLVVDCLQEYIAYHSCVGDERGWHWKFDPKLQNYGEMTEPALLQSVTARVDCIYGESSIFNSDGLPAKVLTAFPNPGELVIIPNGHHHLMIDHPLELVAEIKRLISFV